jgi:putative transposase
LHELVKMKYKLTKHNVIMGKAKFTSIQIVDAILAAEAGKKVGHICRELGVSSSTFYNWRNHKDNHIELALSQIDQFSDELIQARLQQSY